MLVGSLGVVMGCHGGHAPAPRAIAPPPAPYVPRPGSGNAFDDYANAALDAERLSPTLLDRVSFFPDQKKAALKQVEPMMRRVLAATAKPCDFQFVAHRPFEPAPFQRGWRLIGRALQWSVDDAIENGRYDEAIADAVGATRFGFDLTGGGATDASLGLAIVDDVRHSLAPNLDKFGAAQLRDLSQGMKDALQRKPPLRKAVENEHQNMLQAVEYVRQATVSGDLVPLERQLGEDGKEVADSLRDLAGNDRKRAEYFDGLAKEADAVAGWDAQTADLTVRARKDGAPLKPAKGRPWARLAREFLHTMEPLLEIDDATLARTKLLVLVAELIRSSKVNKTVPTDLKGFTPWLVTDPYSGDPFVYHSDGADYTIYSVGEDLIDNGGQTDESFTTPDLKLERG